MMAIGVKRSDVIGSELSNQLGRQTEAGENKVQDARVTAVTRRDPHQPLPGPQCCPFPYRGLACPCRSRWLGR